MEGSPCAVGSRAFPRRAAADGDNERLLSAAAAAAARGTMSDRRPSDRVADRTHERVHTRISACIRWRVFSSTRVSQEHR